MIDAKSLKLKIKSSNKQIHKRKQLHPLQLLHQHRAEIFIFTGPLPGPVPLVLSPDHHILPLAPINFQLLKLIREIVTNLVATEAIDPRAIWLC